MKKHPPQLIPASQCANNLDFRPLTTWPEGLPAVAINGTLVAGFQQAFAFNHTVEPTDKMAWAHLFRSLYGELSSCELARLWMLGRQWSEFPKHEIFNLYQVRWNANTEKLSELIVQIPLPIQNFCSEKKWSFGDFQPLASAADLPINEILVKFIDRNCSRSHSVQIFELAIELLIQGHNIESLLGSEDDSIEDWLSQLQKLRYPQTSKKDAWAVQQTEKLPWPSHSQARWIRRGDQSGIELKLFVSQPSDLKKYVHSLSHLQTALENEGPWKKH